MKILHRYILSQLLRNLIASILIFVFLFTVFDFFDRIDNILEESPPLLTIVQYFLFKMPLTLSLMLPLAMLVASMFTIGILSKNSEFTAMRATGLPILWLVRPIFIVALVLSVLSIGFNETLVPYATRRVREIYNIDIKQKDKRGNYSQSDFWWRTGNTFYSAGIFDSRDNTLLGLSALEVNSRHEVTRRVLSTKAAWLNPALGWNMNNVVEYSFSPEGSMQHSSFERLPLPIQEKPKDFYDAKTDPHTMSYQQLEKFILQQEKNGLSVTSYLADLYAKISFPFVTFIITLVAIPFALTPARSGSMAASFLAGLIIGFSYYAVHSFSIAFGRAELWPPLMAAWMANILLGLVGAVLNLGSESPA